MAKRCPKGEACQRSFCKRLDVSCSQGYSQQPSVGSALDPKAHIFFLIPNCASLTEDLGDFNHVIILEVESKSLLGRDFNFHLQKYVER